MVYRFKLHRSNSYQESGRDKQARRRQRKDGDAAVLKSFFYGEAESDELHIPKWESPMESSEFIVSARSLPDEKQLEDIKAYACGGSCPRKQKKGQVKECSDEDDYDDDDDDDLLHEGYEGKKSTPVGSAVRRNSHPPRRRQAIVITHPVH